jgi:hypothetical protein
MRPPRGQLEVNQCPAVPLSRRSGYWYTGKGRINSVGSAGLDYPDMLSELRAPARDVNAHGGLSGHPITIDSCDSKSTASGEAACARSRWVPPGSGDGT